MIRKILTTFAARLDEYLARSHRQPEGVAEVGLIGSAGEQCPNKLVISLVNLGREASGDGGYMQRAATGYAGRRQPCNLVDIGAIGSAKTALQATAGPFSQNRLLLGQRLHPLSGTTAAAKLASLLRMKTAAIKKAGRQYRVVRWFLLPEGELRARQAGSSRLQVFDN